MSYTILSQRPVEKLWGRRALPPPFASVPDDAEPVGEIHFESTSLDHPELLVKYLFTSDDLSIQVHPDNAAAQRAGLPHGKDEAWYVLDADEGAAIALGLKHPATIDQLRQASLDGSVVDLMDWRPVHKGDILYAPAGTVHAIGGGISVVEVQQNLDLTYRLYDYGRHRPLQLEESLAVARPERAAPNPMPIAIDSHRTLLCAGPNLTFERWTGPATLPLRLANGDAVWVIALNEGVSVEGESLDAGSVVVLQARSSVTLAHGATALITYPSRIPLAIAA